MERNQTLFRQLSFRQIAFTLLRRFADPDQIILLDAAVKQFRSTHELELKSVQNQFPTLPAAPSQPDHLNLSGPPDR